MPLQVHAGRQEFEAGALPIGKGIRAAIARRPTNGMLYVTGQPLDAPAHIDWLDRQIDVFWPNHRSSASSICRQGCACEAGQSIRKVRSFLISSR